MLQISALEKDIQELGYERSVEEAKAAYQQKIDQIVALRELARHKIVHNAMTTNYGYASTYANYLSTEDKKLSIGSEKVIDFVHHVSDVTVCDDVTLCFVIETASPVIRQESLRVTVWIDFLTTVRDHLKCYIGTFCKLDQFITDCV